MIGEMIYSAFTSTLVMAVLAAIAAGGIVGTWLNLIPAGWAVLASLAGRGALIAVIFIFGCRFADERHDLQSLKNKLEIKETDLRNEQDARKVDLTVIKELSAEKEKAERNRDELSDYIAKLPTADQCIATPDLLKRLHKSR